MGRSWGFVAVGKGEGRLRVVLYIYRSRSCGDGVRGWVDVVGGGSCMPHRRGVQHRGWDTWPVHPRTLLNAVGVVCWQQTASVRGQIVTIDRRCVCSCDNQTGSESIPSPNSSASLINSCSSFLITNHQLRLTPAAYN